MQAASQRVQQRSCTVPCLTPLLSVGCPGTAPQVESYDKYGYDSYGYDKYGYDKYGYGKDGYHKEGYDRWATAWSATAQQQTVGRPVWQEGSAAAAQHSRCLLASQDHAMLIVPSLSVQQQPA